MKKNVASCKRMPEGAKNKMGTAGLVPYLRYCYRSYRNWKKNRRRWRRWKASTGELPMPPYGKIILLKDYVARFNPQVFIETGTYMGDMVHAMLNSFEEIYSIELDRILAKKAKERFAEYRRVHIIEGESGQVLPGILKDEQRPCLFWLDAHYSGGSTAKGPLDTPIIQELNCILNHDGADHHVLLIDDARCFTGENDYPDLKTLEKHILNLRPGWVFEVKDDIIRTLAKV